MDLTFTQAVRDFERSRLELIQKKYFVEISLRKLFSKIVKSVYARKSTLRRNTVLLKKFERLQKLVNRRVNENPEKTFNEPFICNEVKLFLQTSELLRFTDISDEDDNTDEDETFDELCRCYDLTRKVGGIEIYVRTACMFYLRF